MQVILATLVKNEADRYWDSALAAWSEFADKILYLDDLSDDHTKEIAARYEKAVDITPPSGFTQMWGDEKRYRVYLFDRAMKEAEPGDVIFWEDADMVPAANPRPYFEIEHFDGWAWVLYDMWSPDEYRDDTYWRAHDPSGYRIWAIRKPEGDAEYEWRGRKIHCGHIPGGWWEQPHNVCFVPTSEGILHYGYADPDDRLEKYKRYMEVKHLLSPHEMAHAQSIMDKPVLRRLGMDPTYRLTKPGTDL